jgi:hypothetical protein
LGLTYAELPIGERAANLQRAIDCYHEALRFRTIEADPSGYAIAQHNLGDACLVIPIGDRAANLARAIDCYNKALPFRTAEADPLNYASIQHNLGVACAGLPTGTGRPTWPGRLTVTPRRCGSAPPRSTRLATPTPRTA